MTYAPLNVNTEGGGGGGGRARGRDLTFLQKKCQMPLPQYKIPGQNSPPPG